MVTSIRHEKINICCFRLALIVMVLMAITGSGTVLAVMESEKNSETFAQTPFGEMALRQKTVLASELIEFPGRRRGHDFGLNFPFTVSNQLIRPDSEDGIEHSRERGIFISRSSGGNYTADIGEYRVDYAIEFHTDEVEELAGDPDVPGLEPVYTPFTMIRQIRLRIWIFHNDSDIVEEPVRDLLVTPIKVDTARRGLAYEVSLPPLRFTLKLQDFQRGLDELGRYSFDSVRFLLDVENSATFAGGPVDNARQTP
ncbi:MAG: hypothetical protein CVV64_02445 [Candidatus Wallbacteria bacterium HGW-Wallbacteria-1]|uniref:Uncharacterized protein n=1 Tax=Candidatus Wallbacteria bacterium HGW-Wallbacteria-1 TaxID=2013854 RepID=A0A2N1PVD0_9BACT|nr:MAG: hypothetical protein CVV64_02445 [Candidatus Wallbacteria bacterium HGW-Wallbacteria-1]